MHRLISDLNFGARQLWKNKGYTSTAVTTLAICIGLNAVIFSVVHSVVLRPLPFPESDRILLMYNSYPGAGVVRAVTGVPDYYDRLGAVTVFEEQALYQEGNLTIGSAGSVQQVRGLGVTPSFFRLLKAKPRLGRNFNEEEGEVGKERRAILSHALWQELYGGNESVIGKEIRIYGNPHTIVGVLPQGFVFLDPQVRLYRPLAFTLEQRSDQSRHNNSWEMIGRLKPEATLQQAQSQIDAINTANMQRFPALRQILSNARFSTRAVPLQDEIVKPIRKILYLLWGGAAFVLLIGIINIANLAVARSSVRMKELATRFALGAERWRVTCQLLTESILMTAISAALGFLFGHWGLGLLRHINLEKIPRGAEVRLDGTTVLYILGVSLLAAIAIGVIPVIQGLRVNLASLFREELHTTSGGRGARLLRNGLVVAQVAFALILLMGAGLLSASFRHVLAIRPGFVPEQVVTGTVVLPSVRYPNSAAQRAFRLRAMEKVRALPGVIEAGATDTLPFCGNFNDSVILAEGYIMKPGESMISGDNIATGPGYFAAMKVPLREGRFFEERDTPDSLRVIIIDEKLARKFFMGVNPVGKRMWRPTNMEALQDPAKGAEYFTIVGVVASVKLRALVDAEERIGSYYFPLAQSERPTLSFAVRTEVAPTVMKAALRKVINEVDPELPFSDAFTMQERIDDSLTNRRSPMLLSLCFAAVALFLAGVGIYGVLAYLVAQRTKEIGIRMALGSDAARIFKLVFLEGVVTVGCGLVLGVVCSWMLGRYLESVLYGVRPLDPIIMTWVGLALIAVAMVASTLPAWRATQVNPIIALRQE